MSSFEIALIVGMTLVTFGVRYPVLALVSRVPMPPSLERALRYIPAAVLAAIITPALLMPEGRLWLRLDNASLVAGIAAMLIAWRTRNLLLTIALGMATFWVWRFVVGMV
jgi:branched-subunit amino acid transport protein